MIPLAMILGALRHIPAVIAAVPQVKEFFDQAIGTLREPDQKIAREAYADLMADNDAGFARLDAKLAEAEKR